MKQKKTILGIVFISLLMLGFASPSVSAYFVEPGGGNTRYSATRSATKTSTRSATKSATKSSTDTAIAKYYDFKKVPFNAFLNFGTEYNILLHSSETRSYTATETATRSATRSATATRYSYTSQAAANAAAQSAADSIAQSLANSAALALANSAALALADYEAQYQADILARDFAILEAQLSVDYTYPSSPVDNSLVTIHGFDLLSNGGGNEFFCLDTDPRFSNWYGAGDIRHVHYYDADSRHQPEFDGFDAHTPIEAIAAAYRNLLIRWHNEGEIKDNIDIMAHSMGGLVTRTMIKLYYPELVSNGITINHIATMGTPNYGVSAAVVTYLLGIAGLILSPDQLLQMFTLSPFLIWLNYGDDTPYSVLDNNVGNNNDIIWSTFAGFHIPILSTDGVVDTWNIQLDGNDVTNYGIYEGVNHGQYWTTEDVVEDLYYEITKKGFTKPQSSETLPGDFTIEPLSGDTYRIKMVLTENYDPEEHAITCRVVINNKAYTMNVDETRGRYLDEWGRWVFYYVYYYNYFDVVIPQGEHINFYCMAFKDDRYDWYRMTTINAFYNW